MKINRRAFDIALAEKCLTATDLRKDVSSVSLLKIKKGEDVSTAVVGKIAKALGVAVQNIIE